MSNYADVQLQIAQWRTNLPMLTEIFAGLAEQYPVMAKQYRLYYTALIDAGFTASDAVDGLLCDHPRLTLLAYNEKRDMA